MFEYRTMQCQDSCSKIESAINLMAKSGRWEHYFTHHDHTIEAGGFSLTLYFRRWIKQEQAKP